MSRHSCGMARSTRGWTAAEAATSACFCHHEGLLGCAGRTRALSVRDDAAGLLLMLVLLPLPLQDVEIPGAGRQAPLCGQ